MHKRPLSISIIAWYLTIAAALSLLTNYVFLSNPKAVSLLDLNFLPFPIFLGFMYLSSLLKFTSGIGMLTGKNWARYLYLAITCIGFVISSLIMPSFISFAIIPSGLIFIIVLFILFSSKANAYFKQSVVSQ